MSINPPVWLVVIDSFLPPSCPPWPPLPPRRPTQRWLFSGRHRELCSETTTDYPVWLLKCEQNNTNRHLNNHSPLLNVVFITILQIFASFGWSQIFCREWYCAHIHRQGPGQRSPLLHDQIYRSDYDLFFLSLSLYLTVQVSNQDPLGGGSLWSQITKSVSDYQLNSVQAQVGVVFDQ